jgi:DNA-binding beta-propeller fold protein YncE
MAVDGQNVFVLDTVNQRAKRFSAAGSFQLGWGERGWGEGNPGFNWGRDMTIDPLTNTVWVADTKNYRFTEFTRDGAATGRTLGRFRGAAVGEFDWPYAVVSYAGDLVVTDTNNHRVQRWDLDGPTGPTLVWEATGLKFPKDVTVSGTTVYVADSLNARIVRLDASDGRFVSSFGGSDLHRPEGVAVAPDGHVWVADTSWNRLVEFDSNGNRLQIFGGSGTTHGKFRQPAHLEILDGPSVELFVADAWNDRIEVFTLG